MQREAAVNISQTVTLLDPPPLASQNVSAGFLWVDSGLQLKPPPSPSSSVNVFIEAPSPRLQTDQTSASIPTDPRVSAASVAFDLRVLTSRLCPPGGDADPLSLVFGQNLNLFILVFITLASNTAAHPSPSSVM